MYSAVEELSLQSDRNRYIKARIPHEPSFGLMSENGQDSIMVLPGGDADVKNVPQTRKMSRVYSLNSNSIKYVENVSYLVLEGSTLTMMGTLQYNADTGKVELTKVASMFAGGAQEALRYLKDEIKSYSRLRLLTGLGALASLVLMGLIVRQYKKEKKEKEMAEELKQKN